PMRIEFSRNGLPAAARRSWGDRCDLPAAATRLPLLPDFAGVSRVVSEPLLCGQPDLEIAPCRTPHFLPQKIGAVLNGVFGKFEGRHDQRRVEGTMRTGQAALRRTP